MGSISQGVNACRNAPRRYLIVPDAAMANATVTRCARVSDGVDVQEGLGIRQPTPDIFDAPAGDIRATLSGIPEVEVEGDLNVTKAGVVENARYSWVRAEDDTLTDWQLRQSPHVVGRRPDVIRRFEAPSETHIVRPKLLSLVSGDLMCVYTTRAWTPWFGDDAATLATFTGSTHVQLLDHGTDTWGSAVTVFSAGAEAVYVSAVDIVQFPDTAEIVMFIGAQNDMSAPTVRILYVYYSVDDGVTWTQRGRLHFNGIPDITLTLDASAIQCWAAEILPSGRIVLAMVTEDEVWSLTSDDRGASWGVTSLGSTGATNRVPGHGLSIARTRNGMLALVVTIAAHSTVANYTSVSIRFTGDGVTYGSGITVFSLSGTLETAMTVSPDGWPHIYATTHYNVGTDALLHNYDWIWGRRLTTRDPGLEDVQSDIFPIGAGVPYPLVYAFHCLDTAPSGTYSVPRASQIAFAGFTSIDAVAHRGQMVVAAVVQRDTPGGVGYGQPPLGESALVVYRTNHWQPIQERLGDARNLAGVAFPDFLAAGKVYGLTWDCYGLPENWGYAPVGAGTRVITAGGAEGGYLTTDGPILYSSTATPAAGLSLASCVRLVVMPILGGSQASGRVTYTGAFGDGVNSARYTVRFDVNGAVDAGVGVYVSGALLGSVQRLPQNQWVEVLITTTSDSGGNFKIKAACRTYPRTDDPDWDEPYLILCDASAPLFAALDQSLWGQTGAIGADITRWKSIHVHQSARPATVTLTQWGSPGDTVDSDSDNDTTLTGTGEAQIDHGIDNLMRTSQTTAVPAQFTTRNAHASWRGEAVTNGRFNYESGFTFGADNVQETPVIAEWRSTLAAEGADVEIVFDSGLTSTERPFRPDAMALFGRNFPGVTVQFNGTDSWGAPTATYELGWPGDGGSPDRYSHLWAFEGTGGWRYAVNLGRVTVFAPIGAGPWRPHQFASQATGPRFYVVWNNTAAGIKYVFRIEDNTADTLTLATNPTFGQIALILETGVTYPYRFAIFSDRASVLLGQIYPATYTQLPASVYPNSHVRGYRYMRLLIPACVHADADESFYRLGFACMGSVIDIASPNPQWGFSRQEESGVAVNDMQNGTSFAVRNYSPRRTVAFDYAYLMPSNEMLANVQSPEQGAVEPDDSAGVGTRTSWPGWLDLVRRMQLDGLPGALVWEGDRAYAEPGGTVAPVASDPTSLLCVRCVSAGTPEHIVWQMRELNLDPENTQVPMPICAIKGISFREEF